MQIHHNVIRDTQTAGIKVHYGSLNRIWNNLFLNTSNVLGNSGSAQLLAAGSKDMNTSLNVFDGNIVVMHNESTEKVLSGEFTTPYFSSVDRNLYFNPQHDLETWNRTLTPLGTFLHWQEAGYDTHSLVADPLFRDPDVGDFCLEADSPAFAAIGFTAIPDSICMC